MGHQQSKFQNTYVLHYYPFNENKLYVFLPRFNEFYCFSVFYCNRKYTFYADTSIVLPNGRIYFIGGERLVDPSMENLSKAVAPTDSVVVVDLNKHRGFKINIEDSGAEKSLRALPEPRTFHSLVYVEPYIYVIGGLIDNKFTRKCYRYHVEENKWSEIAEMSQGVVNVTEPGVISVGGETIYVFDSFGKEQTIHKYNIKDDQWVSIPLQTNGFTVLPAVSNIVFQISETNLVLINGMMKENEGYYYFFDLVKEKFILEQKHPCLKNWHHDRQGQKNYDGFPLYCMLNEKRVKVFDTISLEWREEDLFLSKMANYDDSEGSAVCCGR